MLEHRVFVVDDDPSWQDLFRESIEGLDDAEVKGQHKKEERHIVQVASSYEEADAMLDRQHFHLAVIDLRLQEGTEELEGKKLVQKIAETNEGTSIIVVSGYADATIATELLRGYDNVFYLIEKDNFDSKRLIEYVKGALSWAREQYRVKFASASALDFLSRHHAIDQWVADVLQVILGTDRPSKLSDKDDLRDLLDELLTDLYPLLYHQMDKGAIIDSEASVVSARCWSKALGKPILVKFSRRELIDREMESMDTRSEMLAQRVFIQKERTPIVKGFRGIVYVPVYPPFEDFEGDIE